ncbi:YceI family protein [Flavobacterium tructae]|uniref:YceI family protein n=1 Tax=Flavobacterium tructae TaxID=1114873 RepID=UPI0035A8EFE0
MRNKFKVLLVAFLLITAGYEGYAQKNKKNYGVDLEKSVLRWKGKKLVGYSHEGILKLSKAELVLEDAKIINGFFVVNMNSLLDSDAIKDPKQMDLTNHLKAEDFFDVKKYPVATIKITGMTPIKDNPDAGEMNHILTGELTIKGITNKVGFPVAVSVIKNSFEMKGTLVFNRSKWNIKYGSGSFFDGLGDEMISDDIEVKIFVQAKTI